MITSPEGNASWEAMEEMLTNAEDFYQVRCARAAGGPARAPARPGAAEGLHIAGGPPEPNQYRAWLVLMAG
jgi:hypothetical protein